MFICFANPPIAVLSWKTTFATECKWMIHAIQAYKALYQSAYCHGADEMNNVGVKNTEYALVLGKPRAPVTNMD